LAKVGCRASLAVGRWFNVIWCCKVHLGWSGSKRVWLQLKVWNQSRELS
jgi:hypothetical protein